MNENKSTEEMSDKKSRQDSGKSAIAEKKKSGRKWFFGNRNGADSRWLWSERTIGWCMFGTSLILSIYLAISSRNAEALIFFSLLPILFISLLVEGFAANGGLCVREQDKNISARNRVVIVLRRLVLFWVIPLALIGIPLWLFQLGQHLIRSVRSAALAYLGVVVGFELTILAGLIFVLLSELIANDPTQPAVPAPPPKKTPQVETLDRPRHFPRRSLPVGNPRTASGRARVELCAGLNRPACSARPAGPPHIHLPSHPISVHTAHHAHVWGCVGQDVAHWHSGCPPPPPYGN